MVDKTTIDGDTLLKSGNLGAIQGIAQAISCTFSVHVAMPDYMSDLTSDSKNPLTLFATRTGDSLYFVCETILQHYATVIWTRMVPGGRVS
jgi:hypothetical protein